MGNNEMKEKTIYWRIGVFLALYVIFSILIGTLFSFPTLQLFVDGNGMSILIFGLTAFSTSYVLKKKSIVNKEKTKKIGAELAAVAFLLPFAIGIFISIFGFLWGANYFAQIISSWQHAGISALIIQIWNQIMDAALVFTVVWVFL